MTVAFTLCSNNYLGQAKVLVDSFATNNPGVPIIIGLIDRKDTAIDYGLLAPAEIVPFESLGVDVFVDMMKRYDIVEFNTAVKPFYFTHLFNLGYDKVLYFDPDIGIFNSLNGLISLFDQHEVLLTPHTVTPVHDHADRWQSVSNRVGIYNLGFLGLRDSDHTRALLKWWSHKLETECRMIPAQGLFVDQIWSNYFPVYFGADCHIVMDPGYNVAYWNFGERQLSNQGGQYLVNGLPLNFFHFSNYKYREPNRISSYSDYTLEQRPDLRDLYSWYHTELKRSGYEEYSRMKPLVTFRSNRPGFFKMTGLWIKIRGTRAFHSLLKKIFDV